MCIIDRTQGWSCQDIADAIGDGRRPTGMSTDQEIVYDFD
jgi:hypothetical protein